MDPEYYMTQQLTEKSDVYSFGVVLLELITARTPIERGKHIVKLVQEVLNNAKDAPNLSQLLDPKINKGAKLGGLNKLIDLAMKCVQDSGTDRPSMGEVVREIENIMQLAAENKTVESEFSSEDEDTTTSGDARSQQQQQQSYGSKAFDYSGGLLSFNLEHHHHQ